MRQGAGSRVRVYMASSLDGYIAGVDDDLSWLEPPESTDVKADGNSDRGDVESASGVSFEAFMSEVGLMLMGRRTYDVVCGFGQWPYGDMPVWVVTHRALEDPPAPTVTAIGGDISEVIARAREAAGEGDVYLDGGHLIRQALAMGLVDEMIVTYIPLVLGAGVSLFDGLEERIDFEFVSHDTFVNTMLQVRMVPRNKKNQAE